MKTQNTTSNKKIPNFYVKQTSQQSFGMLMVILAGTCWGIISIFINALTNYGYNSLQIMCFRTWFSTLFLLIYFLIKDKSLLKINLKDLWMFIGSGVLSLTFFSYCYFNTIISCGAAIAVVLLYTSPIFVMIMSSIVFKEKITKRKIIALIIAFTGCIMVAGLIGGSHSMRLSSLLLGLGAGFGYALYSIFGGLAVKKYSSLTITFYTLLTSGVSMLFICNPKTIISTFSIGSLPYILGVSLICTVVPYICYTFGLMHMEAGKAAVVVTIEPLIGCLLGLFVFHEETGILKIIGMLLILVSVIILSVNNE